MFTNTDAKFAEGWLNKHHPKVYSFLFSVFKSYFPNIRHFVTYDEGILFNDIFTRCYEHTKLNPDKSKPVIHVISIIVYRSMSEFINNKVITDEQVIMQLKRMSQYLAVQSILLSSLAEASKQCEIKMSNKELIVITKGILKDVDCYLSSNPLFMYLGNKYIKGKNYDIPLLTHKLIEKKRISIANKKLKQQDHSLSPHLTENHEFAGGASVPLLRYLSSPSKSKDSLCNSSQKKRTADEAFGSLLQMEEANCASSKKTSVIVNQPTASPPSTKFMFIDSTVNVLGSNVSGILK